MARQADHQLRRSNPRIHNPAVQERLGNLNEDMMRRRPSNCPSHS